MKCESASAAFERPGTVVHRGVAIDSDEARVLSPTRWPAGNVHFVTERQGHFYNAMGQTDATGRFSLQTFRPEDGAVPGRHKVRIQKLTFSEKPADLPLHASFKPIETSHLPAKYRSPETSGLTVEVSEKGPNEFTFSLQ